MALKILIVDDEEPARQGLTQLLARWGYEVDEAADGQEALAKAASGLPAVVLKVGTFDNPALFNPQMAIHTLDKQAFHHVPDGMPAFERLPGR